MTRATVTRRAPLHRCIAVVLILGLLSGTTGCAPWQVGAEKDGVKNGIRFQSFRELDEAARWGSWSTTR